MALLKCPECKKKFSDKAAACPNCGAPLSFALEAKKKDAKASTKAVFAVIALIVISAAVSPSEDEESAPSATPEPQKVDPQVIEFRKQAVAKEYVQFALKDVESAEFRNQRGFCGEVNARNGFGGKTGFKRFVAVSNELVAIEGESLKAAEFRRVWDQACK